VLAQILAARNAKQAAGGHNSSGALAAAGGINGLLANLKSQTAIAVKVAGLSSLAAQSQAKQEAAAAAAAAAAETAKPSVWSPQPPDTSDVSLSPELVDIVSDMAQALVRLWRESKSKEAYVV
jgi:membrane protease subunit (stomatin/prohibitin family)